MKTPGDILDFVGHEAAARRLGVSLDRVRRAAKSDRKLPALWLDGLEHLARRPLPRELFYFKNAEAAE
ncbi:MAG: hypothetical protein ACLFRZ_10990 [Rhodosalinus sp.]